MFDGSFRWVTMLSVAVALVACGGGAPERPGATSAKGPDASSEADPTSAARELAGTWTMRQQGQGLTGHVDVPLTIDVEGSHVMGRFAADQGTIDGELKENEVVGSWKESDGEGDFNWHLSRDGKTFDGKFTGMLHSKQVPEGARWSGVHE